MRNLLRIVCIFLVTFSFSQELVLVKFKDKPLVSHYFSNPTEMLTQKALDRRLKYNIPLSDTDVPVHGNYIDAVKNLNIPIIVVSKWFNGVFVEIDDFQKSQIQALDCVLKIESLVKNSVAPKLTNPAPKPDFSHLKTSLSTDIQIEQIGLNHLHDLNYTGKNISIAVMDAGFPGVNTISAFDRIRANQQIKGGYNFTESNTNIYSGNGHGTNVLSIIGGYIPGQYTGTAIDADFYLYVTEKNGVEIPQEEVWWIASAEKADSLGVDIITTSLGYHTFDDSRYNYTIDDMDGETAFISRGAQIAAEKGIFVVTSAGNEGNSSWKKVSAPADAKDVFSVGAVNSSGYSTSFSSYGPSADGRIKPDVSALGQGTFLVNEWGMVSSGSGTSYSSPIITGAIACLLQACPEVPPSVLKQKIRESAHLYSNPTNQQGYGIPDFSSVLKSLFLQEVETLQEEAPFVYPNPVKDVLFINMLSEEEGAVEIQFFTYDGKLIYFKKTILSSGESHISVFVPHSVRTHHNLIMRLKTPTGKSIARKVLFL
ncbi:MAG: S8 family serine peptidase [Flavobacteriaceae bacterium]|nr:S8 family serine peptidase [Flavobacteriaceae bacterium]